MKSQSMGQVIPKLTPAVMAEIDELIGEERAAFDLDGWRM